MLIVGGFVFCGFILLSLTVPFFAFPKSLSKEKAKLTLADKPDRVNDSYASLADRSGDAAEAGKEYGQNLKGKYLVTDGSHNRPASHMFPIARQECQGHYGNSSLILFTS